MAAMKAKEKEMKDEKEAARQVGRREMPQKQHAESDALDAATHPGYSRQAGEEGREGKVRETGREDASQEGRQVEAKGEA